MACRLWTFPMFQLPSGCHRQTVIGWRSVTQELVPWRPPLELLPQRASKVLLAMELGTGVGGKVNLGHEEVQCVEALLAWSFVH